MNLRRCKPGLSDRNPLGERDDSEVKREPVHFVSSLGCAMTDWLEGSSDKAPKVVGESPIGSRVLPSIPTL